MEVGLLWLALLVVAVALVVSLRPCASETQIRIAGLILQWLGIATVAVGVHQTRRLFGRPDNFTLLRDWLMRFPRWRGDASLEASAAIGAVATGALGYDGAPSIERRRLRRGWRFLIRNVDHLNERLAQLQNDVEASIREAFDFAKRGADATAVRELGARLEAAQTEVSTSPSLAWSGWSLAFSLVRCRLRSLGGCRDA